MKKIILGIALLASMNVSAGMFSMVSGMSMKEIKPQAAYTIDTAGVNPRIYEFDTKIKPIMHCVVLIASSSDLSAPTLQCVPKNR